MARQRSILEYIAFFLALVIVLSPARLIIGETYGGVTAAVCNIFWYASILGFLGCVFLGIYRYVTKGEKKS
jgi:hypothetical protein